VVWVSCTGDLLDVEARTRTRSLYFPFGSVPMFPRCLAEGPFSLGNPSSSSSSSGSDAGACDALSICITLSDDGSLQEVVKLTPSRVRVSHHMVYDEVDADLGMGPGLCQHEDLQLLYEAARLRCDLTLIIPVLVVRQFGVDRTAPCILAKVNSPARAPRETMRC
jgi:exoribonuclease-2